MCWLGLVSVVNRLNVQAEMSQIFALVLPHGGTIFFILVIKANQMQYSVDDVEQ